MPNQWPLKTATLLTDDNKSILDWPENVLHMFTHAIDNGAVLVNNAVLHKTTLW